MKKCFLLCFLFLFALSCSDSNKPPRGVLSKDKMGDVLWDMMSAGEFLESYVMNKDSLDKVVKSSKIYGQVFQVNHITREQFDKSYTYYQRHPILMKTILDSLSRRQSAPTEPVVKPDSLPKKPLPAVLTGK